MLRSIPQKLRIRHAVLLHCGPLDRCHRELSRTSRHVRILLLTVIGATYL
jgi:hypothetical protein